MTYTIKTIYNSDGSISTIYEQNKISISVVPPKINKSLDKIQPKIIQNQQEDSNQSVSEISIDPTQKRVLYLGGFFQAEFSLRASFIENNIDIRFLYDKKDNRILKNPETNNFNHNILDFATDAELDDYIKKFQPDVIIHRCYLNDLVMHRNAYSIARKYNIPYGKYLIETCPEDIIIAERFDNCDFVLYAHNTDRILKEIDKIKDKKHFYFYPYGVGPIEKYAPASTQDELAGFGYIRSCHTSRLTNLRIYTDVITNLNKKLHVFGSGNLKQWSDLNIDCLVQNPTYSLEDTTTIMNKYKIAINFESVSELDGAYSHKMFQTLGCGLITFTIWKPSLEKLFKKSQTHGLIMIKNKKDIEKYIRYYLNNDNERIKIAKSAEKYIHKHFDWYKRFENIMISEKIWNK